MANLYGELPVATEEAQKFQADGAEMTNVVLLARTRDLANPRGIHIIRAGMLLVEATSSGSTGYMQFHQESSLTADVATTTSISVVDATGFQGGDVIRIRTSSGSVTATLTSTGVNETTNVLTTEGTITGSYTAASSGACSVEMSEDDTKVVILQAQTDMSGGRQSKTIVTASDAAIAATYDQTVAVITHALNLRSAEIYGSYSRFTAANCQRLHFIE